MEEHEFCSCFKQIALIITKEKNNTKNKTTKTMKMEGTCHTCTWKPAAIRGKTQA